MSTRSNIELYDSWHKDESVVSWRKGAVLYHHWDGYPGWMGPRLDTLLKETKATLTNAGYPYWWDSQRVGALMVLLSADKNSLRRDVPAFQPCSELIGGIEFLWRVFLGPEDGEYEIRCHSIGHDWGKCITTDLTEVDWKKEVKNEQCR